MAKDNAADDKKKKKGRDDDDIDATDDDDDDDSSTGCEIITTEIKARKHDIYLSGRIRAPAKYYKLFSKLENAEGDRDRFVIHINSGGGQLTTMVQMRNAMLACHSHITTVAEHECSSAAVPILLAGHAIVVKPGSFTMCHAYTQWFGGKAGEVKDQVGFYSKYWTGLMRGLLVGFMDETEFRQMMDGRDFYFNTAETLRRIKKMGRREMKAGN